MGNQKLKRRFAIVVGLSAAAFLLVLIQYVSLMLPGASGDSARARRPRPERGAILDRNGNILALQTELKAVTAWTPHVRDPQRTAGEIAAALKLDRAAVEERLRTTDGFTYIQRGLAPEEVEGIETRVDDGELPGIAVQSDYGRTYPERKLASHVLGFVGTDNVGLDGIEYALDNHLAPNEDNVRGATAYGDQVVLTIDTNIQRFTDQLTRESLEREDAESVTILVMEAKTGQMLAYSSAPAFDPNNFAGASAEVGTNRPARMMYEPGSAFKIFSIAAFLELGAIGPHDVFETDGRYQPNSWGDAPPITDIANYGALDARDIIRRSSNVGTAYASEGVGDESFYQMLKLFGFGERTGIELAGESPGSLRPPESWSYRSKPTIAMGQEIGVTALQMAAAATVFANEGVLLRPQLVRRILTPDGEIISEAEREPVREAVSPGVANTMLDFMRSATEGDGTARRAAVEGMDMAAKTGTAEWFDGSAFQYSASKFMGSTIGLFPADDPEIIVYALVERPQARSIWGERVAAPLVREVAEFLIPYRGMPRQGQETLELADQVVLERSDLPESGNTVPDYRGLPKRALLELFEEEDVSIEMVGSGWVVEQDPAPGTPISDDPLTLRFRLE